MRFPGAKGVRSERKEVPGSMNMNSASNIRSELGEVLARSRSAFIGIAILSAVLNILMLGGSIFMMLVYDTVLPSHSVPTLVSLLLMVIVVYLFQGVIEMIRGRMLVQIGATFDLGLGARIHQLIGKLQLSARIGGDGLQPVRDLDTVRSFMSSAGPAALIDLPWMVFFILILFLMHPALGLTVLVGAIILIGLTYATERSTRVSSRDVTILTSQRQAMAEATRRHAEVIKAMGMGQRMGSAWMSLSARSMDAQQRLTSVASTLGGASKTFRMLLQSVVLAVGALLVLQNLATGGIIFASSILAARALAPVEMAIANWRGFVASRQSWQRLQEMLARVPQKDLQHELPAPTSTLAVEGLSLAPPGASRLTVDGVSFVAHAGEAIAVIGPSGSGKSTLVRGITGIWEPARGCVRLDGAALDQWTSDSLGRHVGYLPQNVELLDGTVAENIARFDPEASTDDIIAAAKLAGVHDLVVRLPDGYQTQVGADGSSLSAGQRQRIALARALYKDPFLIVLDEPNSNLDAEGETALAAAVAAAAGRGAIVLLVAHRQSILSAVQLILYMRDGRALAYGPKEDILRRIAGGEAPKKLPTASVAAEEPPQQKSA
jgi:ATP-binding cassette subfamily C protein